MKPVTDAEQIDWLLTHAVENVYPSKAEVKKLLQSGRRLSVYYGVDPTGPTLHLGHLITLKKLAELQALGHKVILLIGDFTAMIGDPTDKAATRTQLTRKEVLANCKRYKSQAGAVLRFSGPNPVEMKFNSRWLAKMSFGDVVALASHFTVQQMLERDMFETRIADGKPVHLHEFLYPLMQGYDSVAMDVDGEVGGNDQTFNMLAGRTLMKTLKGKEKFVITNALLTDASGKKMGKTEGNMVALTDAPEDMYGKIMSWTDGMIVPGFRLCTDAPDAEVKKIEQALAAGENPIGFKRDLARRVVAWLTGEAAAARAAEQFTSIHQKHETPDDVAQVRVKSGLPLVDLLVAAKLAASKSEARRLVEQKGVKLDGAVAADPAAAITLPKAGALLQKGKRHFVRVIPA